MSNSACLFQLRRTNHHRGKFAWDKRRRAKWKHLVDSQQSSVRLKNRWGYCWPFILGWLASVSVQVFSNIPFKTSIRFIGKFMSNSATH